MRRRARRVELSHLDARAADHPNGPHDDSDPIISRRRVTIDHNPISVCDARHVAHHTGGIGSCPMGAADAL